MVPHQWRIGLAVVRGHVGASMSRTGPQEGTQALCRACNKPISFVGPYWDHLGEPKPKHPAIPREETAVLMEDATNNEVMAAVSIIPIPDGFRYEEALQQLARLVIALLDGGMPEREIAKRLMRYHPAQEGV